MRIGPHNRYHQRNLARLLWPTFANLWIVAPTAGPPIARSLQHVDSHRRRLATAGEDPVVADRSCVASAPFRSRGELVAWRWTRGQPTDIVHVWADRIGLKPWLRTDIYISREEIDAIEFVFLRVFPFWWSRDVYFRLNDGSRVPKLFRPLRCGRFRAGVKALGYPVRDLGREGLRKVRS
jgi:hypothetical protein